MREVVMATRALGRLVRAVHPPAARSGPGPALDDPWFRVPGTLAVDPQGRGRVLVVGECLAEWFAAGAAEVGRASDFVLFNNYASLPAELPHPAGSYDFQVVLLPLRSIVPEWAYLRLPVDDPAPWHDLWAQAEASLGRMLSAALRYHDDHGLVTFVAGFLVPQQNPLGRLLPRNDPRNVARLVRHLDDLVADRVAAVPDAYFFDVDAVASSIGKRYVQDDVVNASTHGAFLSTYDDGRDRDRIVPPRPLADSLPVRTEAFRAAAWAELHAMHRTARQLDQVKLVVVDLDDTLWRGVVADAHAVTDDTLEGWPIGMVEALFALRARGVLLAIASNNDASVVEELWPTIFRGRLELDDFVARAIDWRPKAEKVADIVGRTNVLPTSVVYVDDNPAERAAVEAALPGVRVLGADLYAVRRTLLWSAETQVPAVTAESARRTATVRAGIARDAARLEVSREEFLAGLGLSVRLACVGDPGDGRLARVVELVNRTNQCNTTGERWDAARCRTHLAAGGIFVVFEVADRFADYGLVGVVVVSRPAGATVARLDQLVMSCRVFGLDVERAVVASLVADLAVGGVDRVEAALVPTGRNGPCLEVFDRCGFTEEPGGTWVAMPADVAGVPAWAAVTWEGRALSGRR
jgi:FkbH-like protein